MKEFKDEIKKELVHQQNPDIGETLVNEITNIIAHCTSVWSEFDLGFCWDSIDLECKDKKVFVTLVNLTCSSDGEESKVEDFTFSVQEYDERVAYSTYNEDGTLQRTSFMYQDMFLHFYV